MKAEQPENANNPKRPDHASINVKDLLLKYVHYAWLFALLFALTLVGAWLYLRYTKPLFSVTGTLLIRNDNPKGGGANGQDMFADLSLFQSNTNKQNEILILSSRTMMERVVRALGLQEAYFVEGNVKTTNIYREQPFDLQVIHLTDSSAGFSLKVHLSQTGKSFSLGESSQEYYFGQEIKIPQATFRLVERESFYHHRPFRNFIVQWLPIQYAAGMYAGGLRVAPANDQSNVLSLTYITENPKLGADIVNKLMEEYNHAAVEDKNEINRKILAFIQDRLSVVEDQLDSVEIDLQRYKTSRQVIDLGTQSEMYFGNMGQLEQNVRDQEIQLQVAELLEQYVNQPTNRLSLVPSTLGLTDPTLLELTANYNQLIKDRLVELQTGATPNNPVVKNLEQGIEEARLKIMRNLENIKRVYRNTINSLQSQRGSLRKEIASIPEKERQSRERVRQQEMKQNLYLYLLQKREESEIAQASVIANSRVIDEALPVSRRVRPIPMRIYTIALLAGLLIPIIVIYLLDLMNDKVITRSDVTQATAAPLLGEIGHSEYSKILLFPDKSRTVVAEQLRILRSNLRFLLGDKFENPVILVTSSFSGEGKSFISTNLGATLAVSGKRTVILEFDLRKPKILAGLGLSKKNGLTNYLVGGAQLEELPQAVPNVNNLYVIPCGPVPPNPSEILLTDRIRDLFAWLHQNFDAIVIDTAPVGLVSDALTLSHYANTTIYVIRQRYTNKRQLQFIEELYQLQKLPHMGIIVNDVISKGAKSYYGYGGGRYGYGYGYGYGHNNGYYDEQKPRFWRKMLNKFI